MLNQNDKKSGLTGITAALLYFCWKEKTVNSQVFQKILNSKIAPGANTAFGEHNYVLV